MSDLLRTLQAFDFGRPGFLLLLLALIPLAFLFRKPRSLPSIRFSSVSLVKSLLAGKPQAAPVGFRPFLELVVLGLIIIALAQPRIDRGVFEQEADGIDIMLVVDISKSMENPDFLKDGKPATRYEVLHDILIDFINKREFDRIGVIGFAQEPYLISPLTLDKDWIRQCMEHIEFHGGTNIGGAMDAATRFLQESESDTKIAILLTDGYHNKGTDPAEATPRAKEAGIRFYTAAIVPPAQNNARTITTHPLGEVARETGGQFFAASDADGLRSLYTQIDRFETTEFRQSRSAAFQDLSPWFAGAALAVLVAGGCYRAFYRRTLA